MYSCEEKLGLVIAVLIVLILLWPCLGKIYSQASSMLLGVDPRMYDRARQAGGSARYVGGYYPSGFTGESAAAASPAAPSAAKLASDALAEKSWQDTIESIALESDVSDSHKKWISDVHHSTTTASVHSVRTDPNDIVPWRGLRRPKYRSGAEPMYDARVTSSETPNQLHHSRSFCL